MKDSSAMQTVWGLTNHRSFDLFAAAWMVVLFLIYYVRNPRNENREELVQFGLYMTVMLLLVTLASEALIQFHRLSPANTNGLREQAVLLSDLPDLIHWKVKISSNNSFPGDHATVLLLIGSCIILRLRSWYGWTAAFGMAAFALPRLAGGGHWLSDILAGSLFFYLFFFPLLMCAPVRERALLLLRRPAGLIYKMLPFSGRD
jgi:membrane-associated phospholipid phosphatase